MLILRAAELGMCFGVRDALLVLDAIGNPRDVTIHGELVHNGEVLAALDRRGFHRSPEQRRPVPDTPVVLVTAHGISDRERQRLLAAGKQLVDTTCPLVHKVHAEAQRLQARGARVLVIGKQDHVEVRGIVEDLRQPVVLGTPADVVRWPERHLGIVCQTTTQEATKDAIVAAVRAANPHATIDCVDTICSPTRARIAALDALLDRVDGLVVVGGRESNNTRQLAARAALHGMPTLHVERALELDPAWFAGRRVVGLTAGTSTLPRTVDEVHAALVRIGAQQPPARSSA